MNSVIKIELNNSKSIKKLKNNKIINEQGNKK